MGLVGHMADGASAGRGPHPPGSHRRVSNLLTSRALEIASDRAPHQVVFLKILISDQGLGAPPPTDLRIDRGHDVRPSGDRQAGATGDAVNDPPGKLLAGALVLGAKVGKQPPSTE